MGLNISLAKTLTNVFSRFYPGIAPPGRAPGKAAALELFQPDGCHPISGELVEFFPIHTTSGRTGESLPGLSGIHEVPCRQTGDVDLLSW
jgi:hypothetical protein